MGRCVLANLENIAQKVTDTWLMPAFAKPQIKATTKMVTTATRARTIIIMTTTTIITTATT